MGYVDIVFDGAPGPDRNAGFIRVENAQGRSIAFGQWLQRDDGRWVLRMPAAREASEEVQAALPRSTEGERLSILPRFTQAGYFGEANLVTITDGERTALYVPLSPDPFEAEPLQR